MPSTAVGHYENFPVASVLLPAALRRPVAIIYRFARNADDFADEGDDPPATRLARLQAYRDELAAIERGAEPADRLFRELRQIVDAYALPLQLLRDLLDAFSQDVVKTRYADFAEVLDYCRRSANPVGRLLLHLFGAANPDNLQRSDRICTSLQLINFWQDVPIDLAKDRVYLPQDELQRFAVSEQQIARGETGDAWRGLMRFQVERARAMMLEGAPLGRLLPGRTGLEIRSTVEGGLRILEKLERAGYDMFRHRPVLRAWDWPVIFARAL
jgi:squalene synthase HpnC